MMAAKSKLNRYSRLGDSNERPTSIGADVLVVARRKIVNSDLDVLALSVLLAVTCASRAFCQIDTTWTLTVSGQTVRSNEDGSFRIPNVSAADVFGPGGPGTAPDFLSDDFVRIVGTGLVGGVPHWAFSDPFQFSQGETYIVPSLTITDVSPPLPERIEITAPASRIKIGETVQLTVTATLRDGSPKDVTERRFWTTYRTSNPAVAIICQGALKDDEQSEECAVLDLTPEQVVVLGKAVGTAFITATNEAATSVVGIGVTSDFIATTFEGFAQTNAGTPLPNSTVGVVCRLGGLWESVGLARTESDGRFSIPVSALAVEGTISIHISGDLDGQIYSASVPSPPIVRDGFTDVGLVSANPLLRSIASREFSLFVFHPMPSIIDVTSRELSAFAPFSNPEMKDALSREFGAFAPFPEPLIRDSFSREFSVSAPP